MASDDWGGGDGGGSSWDSGGSTGGDSYSETSSEGWLSRVGKAIMAIPIGLLLFVISFVVLFWNEGRAVHTAQGLAEGKSSVVSIESDKVDPANETKLVHVTGKATTNDILKDPQLGVSEPGAIRLRRLVRMYQWIETSETKTRKKLGGGEEKETIYKYHQGWSDQKLDSSKFKVSEGHENPGNWPLTTWNGDAQTVTVGAFKLSDSLIQQLSGFGPLLLMPKDYDALSDEVKSTAKLNNGLLFRGDDPAHPQVGDMTIAFEVVRPQPVALLAKQAGNSFAPYLTGAGTTIDRLQPGNPSAEEMFQDAEAENNAMTWILRLVGFILMAVGIAMVLSPLSVLADVVPFIGNIVGFGTGFIAIGVALVLSLVTIAIGWIVYRPIIGVAILAVAGLILFLFVKLARDRRSARMPGSSIA
jgi:hypothetical protein